MKCGAMFLPPRRMQVSGFLAMHVFTSSSLSDYALPIFRNRVLMSSPFSLFIPFLLIYPSCEGIEQSCHAHAMSLPIRLFVVNLLLVPPTISMLVQNACSLTILKSNEISIISQECKEQQRIYNMSLK